MDVTSRVPAVDRSLAITVIVTVRDDPHLDRALLSLHAQSRPPSEILVADGGENPMIRGIIDRAQARDPRVRRVAAPGSIAESRNGALAAAHGDLFAFLDTDETAPPDWLERLVAPFDDPTVGFTGGPTPAAPGTARTRTARYYDAYLRQFYDRVARHRPHALPMGNSAWRAQVFRDVGRLDESLSGSGSEDQDVALRALGRGWKGVYVPEAVVDHDFSEISLTTLFRKQRRYAKGGWLVWRRRRMTYEATPGRLLPYVLLPLVGLVGLVMLAVPSLFWPGLALAAIGWGGLGALALVLTTEGREEDRRYPGYRYRALEIVRRWATLVGAIEGFFAFGWNPRVGPATGPVGTSTGPAPRSPE